MFTFKHESNDFGAGAGKIMESGRVIGTPTRALTSKELEHGEKLVNGNVTFTEFSHPLYETTKYFSKLSVASFVKSQEVSARMQKQVSMLADKGRFRITMFHPMFDPTQEISDDLNDKLVELQIQSGFDTISIFDSPKLPVSEFEQRFKKSIKVIEAEYPLEPMAYLRMDSKPGYLPSKLEIIKELGIKTLNVNYVSPMKYFYNYIPLRNFAKDNEVYVHMSEVDRKWLSNHQTALMHLLPFMSISSFAVKQSRPFKPGKYNVKNKAAKRFDAGCLGHITHAEHLEEYGQNLRCKCFADKGRSLDSFYETYNGSQMLNSALAAHETNSSIGEFGRFRREILGATAKEYAKGKEFLVPAFKKILKIDFKDSVLGA